MLLTNHSLTGIVLGLNIDSPVLLAPVAVASHLALDSTPHFYFKRPPKQPGQVPGSGFKNRFDFIFGSIDFGVSCAILVSALIMFPDRRGHIALGWLGAVAPDLLYLSVIFFDRNISGAFGRLHTWVQWSETPWGIITEIAWASAMITLIVLH